MQGFTPMPVDEWISKYKSERILEYLFVAYTAEQFSHSEDQDMQALHHIAEKAARDAGLPAYWIGCSCMPETTKVHEDVGFPLFSDLSLCGYAKSFLGLSH